MAALYDSYFSVVVVLLVVVVVVVELAVGQQSYVNNRQLDCDTNYSTTLGFVCNSPAAAASCPSYITFRSTPTYSNLVTVAYLLSADGSQIALLNNVSDVDPLPPDTLLRVPVNCTCNNINSNNNTTYYYYQHNASYILRHQGETYFSVANNTYQALTTCQSMEAQNPAYNLRRLVPNLNLTVPLRCACPTTNQTAAGFSHLLTYLVRQGDTYDSIARAFSGAGATVQGILDANELSADSLIYFFTPLLVPLTREPTTENINTTPTLPPPPPPTRANQNGGGGGGGGSRRWVFVGVGVGAAVLFLFCAGFLVWFLFFRRNNSKEEEDYSAVAAQESPFSDSIKRSIVNESLTVYTFEDLEKATQSFAQANRINGSSVYLGSFNGDHAAVKIMKGDVSGEIGVLRKINHSHIIRLSGFCLHQGITYLVYEYAHQGSLAESLHSNSLKDDDRKCDSARLDWKQRVQIAYDVADALNYLHNFTRPPYIHKNLTSSNVLLDSNTRAKVANFGLAKSLDTNDDDQTSAAVTRHVVGTYGYMAPEYIENGLVTPKLDVFALGVVMLELLSGKEPIVSVEKGRDEEVVDQVLLSEIIQVVMGGENVREKLQEFMDPWLGKEYPLDVAYSMAELARSCVAQNLNARPLVSEVVMVLSKLLSFSLDWDPSHELQNSTSFSLSD